jgi:hypothetical protein
MGIESLKSKIQNRKSGKLELCVGENRAAGKVIRTTLGELVVAVTDEVMPIIRDPSDLYMVVSFILADLLAPSGVRLQAVTTKIPKLFG